MRVIDFLFLFMIIGLYGLAIYAFIESRKTKASKPAADNTETLLPNEETEEEKESDDDSLYMGSNGLYSIEAYYINSRVRGKGNLSPDEEYEKMIRKEFGNE